MYKSFVFVVSICTILYTANALAIAKRPVVTFSSDQIYSAVRECAGSESKVAELMKIVTEGKVREDDEFKTFIHCTLLKSGLAYENGRVNVEKSVPLYPDPVSAFKVLKRCDEERGPTPLETTFAFFKCFQERSPVVVGI